MPVKSTLQLRSKMFRSGEITRTGTNIVSRVAKEHRINLQKKHIAGPHTGRIYPRGPKGNGLGFSTGHQASDRFQRPAPDTFELHDSMIDRVTSERSAEVTVEADHGTILQEKLDREVLTEEDEKEAERNFVTRADIEIRKIT